MAIWPISTPRLNEASAGTSALRGRPNSCKRAGEAEAVDQPEAKSVTPPLVDIAGEKVLGCHVDDGGGYRGLDDGAGDVQDVERREGKRDRVCNRKSRHDLDHRPQAPCPQYHRGEKGDPVNPPLLGMAKVVSEDAVRRALSKIEEEAGRAWLQEQLDYCTRPLLREPWILDVDTTVKPLYGHQEGAVVGYNPKKPGRPSHTYHSYMLANLRLVLEVEVQAGNQHAAKHSAPGLWTLLDRLGPQCAPWLLRGDRDWGNEGVISEAERRGQAYLFKLRLTKRVKRVLERAMRDDDWRDAGAGWQGKHGEIRLMGWSRQRRVVLLRRRLAGVMITQPGGGWATGARLCRDRRGAPGSLGICCSGDLAGGRGSDHRSALPGPGRL